MAFKIPDVYDCITKLCSTDAEAILNRANSAIRPKTVQLTAVSE
jgi:hypothetical protein